MNLIWNRVVPRRGGQLLIHRNQLSITTKPEQGRLDVEAEQSEAAEDHEL
jgi:hypothetical protein